jgi:hypothetical protein
VAVRTKNARTVMTLLMASNVITPRPPREASSAGRRGLGAAEGRP